MSRGGQDYRMMAAAMGANAFQASVPFADMTLSDLHHKLGKFIEDRPSVINRPEPWSKPWDSDARPLEGLHLDSMVCSTERLEAQARRHLDTLDPEYRARLEAEWNDQEPST